jgi:hypothetical protein
MDEFEFSAFDFNDFRKNFLVEKSLDKTPNVKLGELSRSISKTNAEVAHHLNKWASDIVSKANRYIKRLKKRNSEAVLSVRYIPVGDGNSGEASIIVVKINGEDMEVAIFDNNRVSFKLSDGIAKKLNKGRKRKFMSNKDRVSDYIIGALEKMV